jgi:hypothetical protein
MTGRPDISQSTESSTAPRVIWHLGFQKTATTSAQALLQVNADVLAPYVRVLPKSPKTKALRMAAQDYVRTPSPDTNGTLRAEVEALLCNADRPVIISDETLSGFDPLPLHGDAFSALERLVAALAEITPNAQFVFTTRAAADWTRSVYNQLVRQNRLAMRWEDWSQNVPRDTNWDEGHRRLRATGADVAFVSIEDEAAAGQRPGQCLLRAAGVPEDLPLHHPKPQNTSLPDGALEFMRAINASRLPRDALKVVRRCVVQTQYAFR